MNRQTQVDETLDASDYQRAQTLLRRGEITAGSHLLGEIARRTDDELQRSRCLFNLGEVLDQLGEVGKAYRTWHTLGHRPPAQRNDFDVMARSRVMRLFDQQGLRLPVPDFPPKLQIEVTNRCNLRCIMCTRNQMRRNHGDISFETMRKLADEWGEETSCALSLYFLGEPLLHPELERLVAYINSVRNKRVTSSAFGIQTNGMLLTRDRSRSLLEAGLRGFAFSVDGLEGDLERVRPGASYEVVERNILDLLEVAREMGVDDLFVEISKLCEDPNTEEVQRFRHRWEGKVRRVNLLGITRIEGNAYLGADGTIKEIERRERGGRRHYCGQGQRLLVHWNGDYAFCCGDIDREIDLGNVRERSVREVWNSAEIRSIRRKIVSAHYDDLEVCLRCPHSGG